MQEVLGMKQETKLRHWLHIILVLLTGGLWLAVYGILIALNEMNNRVVRGYNQGWKDGQVTVTQRNMGMSWQGVPIVQALHRSSAGVPQAALSAAEADEYQMLLSVPGWALTASNCLRLEYLRSLFASYPKPDIGDKLP